MRKNRLWQAVGFALVTAVSTGARADGEQCSLHSEVPIERLLRRLSIDLRGTVPDATEYDEVAGKDAVPDDVLQGYLDSDAFRMQMRRYHEDLLWTNPNVTIGEVGFALSSTVVGSSTVYSVSSTGKRKLFRGGDGTHVCEDKPQSALGYDTAGMPNTEPAGSDAVGPYVAEGWIDVHPYWEPDPAKTIRVCAFDAQETASYTLPAGDPDAGTHTCDDAFAIGKSKTCGCGPTLNYCMLTTPVQGPVLAAMREQLLRLVDDSTDGTHPYSDIVLTKRAWINGPLVHYFRYIGQRQSLARVQDIHQQADGPLPDLAFTASDTWVEITREDPHAGILTLPAYLLRFQTNRGRANRYRIAFEGQYFQPPSTKDTGCNSEGEDLTQRCVCRNCHATLEPLAAHFGQFSEAGTTAMRDWVQSFDTYKACSQSAELTSTSWCDRFYVPAPDPVDPDIRPYRLKPLRFADKDHPLIQPHFDAGPGALAKGDVDSGLFYQVATAHMFEFLMKREPNLDPTSPDYEGDLIDQIAKEFQSHDNLKLLVTRLVKLPMYRRWP